MYFNMCTECMNCLSGPTVTEWGVGTPLVDADKAVHKSLDNLVFSSGQIEFGFIFQKLTFTSSFHFSMRHSLPTDIPFNKHQGQSMQATDAVHQCFKCMIQPSSKGHLNMTVPTSTQNGPTYYVLRSGFLTEPSVYEEFKLGLGRDLATAVDRTGLTGPQTTFYFSSRFRSS